MYAISLWLIASLTIFSGRPCFDWAGRCYVDDDELEYMILLFIPTITIPHTNIFMIPIHTTILGHSTLQSSPVAVQSSQPTVTGLILRRKKQTKICLKVFMTIASTELGPDWPASGLTLHNNGNKTDWVFLPPKLTEKRDRWTQHRSSPLLSLLIWLNLQWISSPLQNTITFCYIPAPAPAPALPGSPPTSVSTFCLSH